MYVIKFSNNEYWCGYNHTDPQLRKAMIYKSLKICKATADESVKRLTKLGKLQIGTTYQIVEIEIKEISIIQ